MRFAQLYKNNKQILGTDGVFPIDGRNNIITVSNKISERNSRFKNFPHKIADSFTIYSDRIGSKESNMYFI